MVCDGVLYDCDNIMYDARCGDILIYELHSSDCSDVLCCIVI